MVVFCHVDWYEFISISEVLTASTIRALIITLMMEAIWTSETLVNLYHSTLRYNPEDSHIRIHRRDTFKSCMWKWFIRCKYVGAEKERCVVCSVSDDRQEQRNDK
jgi:hypothetical protein